MSVTDVAAALNVYSEGFAALFGAAIAVLLVDRVIVWFQSIGGE